MTNYRCVITSADGDILADDTMDQLDMDGLAQRYGLKREFLTAYIARSDQGQISNPAGVVMVWRAESSDGESA